MLALLPLERMILARQGQNDRWRPIFIVGAPRSGTSLLYELMVARFRFAYFSNLAHRFYMVPIAVTCLGWPVVRRWSGEFRSRYGHIDGWGAPNEAGWIWARWFKTNEWRGREPNAAGAFDQMRRTIQALSAVFGAPFVNKNVMHSNRIGLMCSIFPGALFIEIKRKETDNVQSIMRARMKEAGPTEDGAGWWSVRPRIADRYIGRDRLTQACAQVLGVSFDIERDSAEYCPGHVFTVDYEELCRHPEVSLDSIRRFLESHGQKVENYKSVPEAFEALNDKRLPEAVMDDQIRDVLSMIESDIRVVRVGGA
ncbi:sulfotransferase [Parvibaculum sp.]|uniref:sulfotransferase family protein n=1 Tax=Parvibaculum sp. TaxID=2024848 RepID=UPI001DFDDC8D|nr:sulfotransferase [Parvibaculum sp.]MBX3489209.1 sulfotransferase [Parvibaculum sp.]